MIGAKSGVMSAMPAHCRLTVTSDRNGNISNMCAASDSAKSRVERVECNSYGSSEAPMTNSPRALWLTYTWRDAETTIGSSQRLIGSDTNAWKGGVEVGGRRPTMFGTRGVEAGA